MPLTTRTNVSEAWGADGEPQKGKEREARTNHSKHPSTLARWRVACGNQIFTFKAKIGSQDQKSELKAKIMIFAFNSDLWSWDVIFALKEKI